MIEALSDKCNEQLLEGFEEGPQLVLLDALQEQ